MGYISETVYGRSATALTASYLCVAALFAVAADLVVAAASGTAAG